MSNRIILCLLLRFALRALLVRRGAAAEENSANRIFGGWCPLPRSRSTISLSPRVAGARLYRREKYPDRVSARGGKSGASLYRVAELMQLKVDVIASRGLKRRPSSEGSNEDDSYRHGDPGPTRCTELSIALRGRRETTGMATLCRDLSGNVWNCLRK